MAFGIDPDFPVPIARVYKAVCDDAAPGLAPATATSVEETKQMALRHGPDNVLSLCSLQDTTIASIVAANGLVEEFRLFLSLQVAGIGLLCRVKVMSSGPLAKDCQMTAETIRQLHGTQEACRNVNGSHQVR